MQTCFHSFALYYMQKKRRFMTGFLYPDINQRCKYVRITQNREQLKTVPDTAGDRNRTGTKFNPRRILSPVRLPVPPRRHHDYSWLAQSQMDGGGFEPPKRDATDLQSAPFGHSGTHPKLLWQLKIITWLSQKSKCFYIFYLIFLFPFFPAFDSSRSTARNHISCRSRISYNAVSFPVKTILPTGGIFTSI